MAGVGGDALQGHQRAVVKAVDWMLKHGQPIDEQTWEGVWEIAQTAKRASTRLMAYREFMSRFDPIPTRPLIEANLLGPTVVIWDLSAKEILPASALTVPKSTSSAGSNGSTSLSVIEAGERPPSESTG